MNKLGSGSLGEMYAARYLRENGYDIIGANYHCRQGEIDIIAQKDGYIVFVEVKTRAEGAMVSGAEAVDYGKRKKIITTALIYLSDKKTQFQPRFDVIEITVMGGKEFKVKNINHIINAFSTEGFNASF